MEIKRQKYALRPLNMNDADSLAYNANNINVWNSVRDYFPHPYIKQVALDFISFVSKKENIEDLTIVVDGKAVGMIGIVPKTDVERLSAEIGY